MRKDELTRACLFLAGVASLVLVVFSVGCSPFEGGGSGEDGGGREVLNDYASSDITDLNSTTTTAILPFSVLNNINEGLYRLGTNHQPQPAQARGVEISPDKKTYTFTLRDGIEWSNGDPVTSKDFRYACCGRWTPTRRALTPSSSPITSRAAKSSLPGMPAPTR